MRFRFQPRQAWTVDRVSYMNIYFRQQRRPLLNYLSTPSIRGVSKSDQQTDLSCLSNSKPRMSQSITSDAKRSSEENSRRRPTSSLSPSPAAWILLRRAALSLRGRERIAVLTLISKEFSGATADFFGIYEPLRALGIFAGAGIATFVSTGVVTYLAQQQATAACANAQVRALFDVLAYTPRPARTYQQLSLLTSTITTRTSWTGGGARRCGRGSRHAAPVRQEEALGKGKLRTLIGGQALARRLSPPIPPSLIRAP